MMSLPPRRGFQAVILGSSVFGGPTFLVISLSTRRHFFELLEMLPFRMCREVPRLSGFVLLVWVNPEAQPHVGLGHGDVVMSRWWRVVRAMRAPGSTSRSRINV